PTGSFFLPSSHVALRGHAVSRASRFGSSTAKFDWRTHNHVAWARHGVMGAPDLSTHRHFKCLFATAYLYFRPSGKSRIKYINDFGGSASSLPSAGDRVHPGFSPHLIQCARLVTLPIYR